MALIFGKYFEIAAEEETIADVKPLNMKNQPSFSYPTAVISEELGKLLIIHVRYRN